jgi:signal transduction histidine kinase
VAASSIPGESAPAKVRRFSARTGLVVAGALIDFCSVINVPGAAEFSRVDGVQVTVTGFGAVLVLLSVGAWVTMIWSARVPLLPLILGGLLAVIGVSYLLLLVSSVAFVRRWPARTRVTGIVAGIVVAVFAVREALTGWGGALAWFLTSEVEALDDPGWAITALALAIVSTGAAAGVVMLTRTKARADLSEQRAAAELRRADALTEQTVRQAERERIARDMHDALAHRLSVVSLHAGALEAAAGEGDAGEIARTVREQTHAAMQDMRGLIGDLRNPIEEPSASPATMRAIGALVSGLRAGGQPITSLILIESPDRASAMLDGAVYRIVQESLTNAIKHAAGASIDVYVQVAPSEGARVRVVNPLTARGIGTPVGGNGILGIRERAAALSGQAWIGPSEGNFIVDVSLPWQERG